ncbi:MAG: hypothetical protein ABEI96_01080 [Haloarculaceae archaeon]
MGSERTPTEDRLFGLKRTWVYGIGLLVVIALLVGADVEGGVSTAFGMLVALAVFGGVIALTVKIANS